MNADLLQVALREIIETKRLVEVLVAASEAFDCDGAREALAGLRKKAVELGNLEAEFTALRKTTLEGVVPFPSPPKPIR